MIVSKRAKAKFQLLEFPDLGHAMRLSVLEASSDTNDGERRQSGWLSRYKPLAEVQVPFHGKLATRLRNIYE